MDTRTVSSEQSAGIALPSTSIASSKPARAKPFFDLPGEIRNQIYLLLAHENFDRAYDGQQPSLLLDFERVIEVNGQGNELVRHMLAFPDPLIFKPGCNNSTVCLPPRYTELQILASYRVSLDIMYPWQFGGFCNEHPSHQSCLKTVQEEITQVSQILSKSRYLTSIRLSLQAKPEYVGSGCLCTNKTYAGPPQVADLLDILEPLVPLAAACGVKFPAEKGRSFCWRRWFPIGTNNIPDGRIAEPFKERLSGYTLPKHSLPPTKTINPECRSCYELFSTDAELHTHLQQHSDHAIPYRQKHPVELHLHARRDSYARHICLTCGVGYNDPKVLRRHLNFRGHRRQGMVSRGEEDQHRFRAGWT